MAGELGKAAEGFGRLPEPLRADRRRPGGPVAVRVHGHDRPLAYMNDSANGCATVLQRYD
jgi:hypothetical protein